MLLRRAYFTQTYPLRIKFNNFSNLARPRIKRAPPISLLAPSLRNYRADYSPRSTVCLPSSLSPAIYVYRSHVSGTHRRSIRRQMARGLSLKRFTDPQFSLRLSFARSLCPPVYQLGNGRETTEISHCGTGEARRRLCRGGCRKWMGKYMVWRVRAGKMLCEREPFFLFSFLLMEVWWVWSRVDVKYFNLCTSITKLYIE